MADTTATPTQAMVGLFWPGFDMVGGGYTLAADPSQNGMVGEFWPANDMIAGPPVLDTGAGGGGGGGATAGVTRNLTGIVTGRSTVTASAVQLRTLPSQPAVGRATVTGSLATVHYVTLSAAPAAHATTTGSLSVFHYKTLTGTTAAGSATVSGSLGVRRGVSATVTCRATVTGATVQSYALRMTSAGRAADTAVETQKYAVSSTSAGRATMVDYLSSPLRFLTTANGVAADTAREGTRYAVTATAAGVGHVTTYLGTPFPVFSTSAGVGHLTAYLGSPFHVFMTAAGRATMTATEKEYTRLALTSAGQGHLSAYLGSPFHVFATSNGLSTISAYLGSPAHVFSTANGRAADLAYLGSPFHVTMASHGAASDAAYLGGTALMPNTVSRGVAHWSLGPALLFALPFQGIGHVNDIRLTGTQRQSITSNGVGTMHDNVKLLALLSNGTAAGTTFDKPPFALVCYAGCRAYYGGAQRIDSGTAYYDFTYGTPLGVFMYLSAPVRFRTESDGRSTFTFPYEMVAISNAGCRAFPTYRSDHDPRFGFDGNNQYYTGLGGVFASQISPDHISSITNSYNNNGIYSAGAYCYGYLSSRVYQQVVSQGVSHDFFLRINEADFHGVGGGDITLGVDHRYEQATSNGQGGWPVNYLPDVRLMRMQPHGVASDRAYQSGNVHFEAGDVTAHGIGTFFIDPGLVYATSHGIGHVFDIARPDAVFMQWGLGDFYYSRKFPVISPLLIPKSSSGIAYVRIEIDQAPVIQQDINGVGTFQNDIGGIAKGMSNQVCRAGSYPWIQAPPDPEHPGQESRLPYYSAPYVPYYFSGQIVHPQGVEVAFTPVEVLIAANGIGKMIPRLRVYYALVWDQGNNEYFDNTQGRYLPTDAHPDPFHLSGSGGRGHFYVAGPRQVQSIAYARARDIFDMSGRFSNVLDIRGIATALFDFVGATGKVAEYGNMLAIHFSIPDPPGYGQFWPRRFRYGTVPVR